MKPKYGHIIGIVYANTDSFAFDTRTDDAYVYTYIQRCERDK